MSRSFDIVVANSDLVGIISEYLGNGCSFPLVLTCQHAYIASRPGILVSSICYYSSSLSLAEWALSLNYPGDILQSIGVEAAYNGRTDVLKWLTTRGVIWKPSICSAAALGGQLLILQWLRSLCPPCPWNSKTACNAAKICHLDMLRYIYDHSTSHEDVWTADVCTAAARGGHLNVLQLLRKFSVPCPWDESVTNAAAEQGWLHILEWATSVTPPCQLHEEICWNAARNGHLGVLQWLRMQQPPCPWGDRTVAAAARMGHLHILHWLWDQPDPFPFDGKLCMISAASGGHLDCLQWLYSRLDRARGINSSTWNIEICLYPAGLGHIHILEWLRSQNPPCPWGPAVCNKAAREGKLEALVWLRTQAPPCPWVLVECIQAARSGKHSDVLEWLASFSVSKDEHAEHQTEVNSINLQI